MRLLNTKKVFIIEVYDVDTLPYAMLSHTWSAEEIVLQEAVKDYCLHNLPTGNAEIRLAVRVLLGDAGSSGMNFMEALKILEGKTDPFLMRPSVHWAIIGANKDMLQSALEAGGDPGVNVDGNITSLHLAMLWDTESLFHLLANSRFVSESLGGEPMAFNGDYPLHFAAAYATSSRILEVDLEETARANDQPREPIRITRILLSVGANSTFPDLDGLAPVHVSCRQGTVGCLKQLIAEVNNANIATGALGLLSIHFAATFGHTECVQALLAAGAKILSDVVNGPVVNALHVAVVNGHDSSARAIWNSKTRTLDFRGWSPCIKFETRGPVLQWMHIEVNDQYWFAIDDPLKEGGIRNFLCSSPENEIPKLWVDLFV